MVVKNSLSPYISAVSATGGGSSTPTWKKLGYSSEAEYLKATQKKPSQTASSGLKVSTPAAAVNSPILAPVGTTKLPGSVSPTISPVSAIDTSALKKNLLESQNMGVIGGGSVGGGGGVTKEGGGSSSGNLVQMPTIKTGGSAGSVSPTLGGTSGVLKPYAAALLGEDKIKAATLADRVAAPTLGYYEKAANSSTTETPTPEARTDEGSYNGTSDFLEAFKQNYGYDYDGSPLERREGMSDGTWNALQSLYKYYQQGQADETKKNGEIESENAYYDTKKGEVEQAYAASREQLGENKGRAQQNASISLDKLLKYLPAQARAQGLESLGMSESAALQAYANYNNNMGDISSEYNAQMANLDQGEISEKGKLDDSRRDSLNRINEKYDAYARDRSEAAGQEAQAAWDNYETERKEKEEQLRKEASAKETKAYEDYRDMLNYSTSTDYDSLVKGIDALNVSDEYKQLLRDKARIVVDANVKAKEEKDKADEEAAKQKAKQEKENLYNSVEEAVRLKIESALGDDGKMSQAAYNEIANYINGYSGRLDPDQLARLTAILEGNQSYIRSKAQEQENSKQDAYHQIVTKDVDFNNNGGWWIFGSTDFSSGDNFSVKDSSGYKYRIESGGEVADEEIAKAAFNVGNNQVFGYGGKIYLKRGGKIYLIQKRANSYEGDYNKLYAKFYG